MDTKVKDENYIECRACCVKITESEFYATRPQLINVFKELTCLNVSTLLGSF